MFFVREPTVVLVLKRPRRLSGPWLKVSSDRLGEPESELGTPGYKAIDLSTCINKKIFTILRSF